MRNEGEREREERKRRRKREAGGDDGIWGETGSNCGCDNLALPSIRIWMEATHMHGTGMDSRECWCWMASVEKWLV